MNWFSLSLQLNRFPIKKAQKALREIQKIPDTEYGAYVERQKRQILQHHLDSNPYYRSFFGDRAPGKWEEVPIMLKSDLQRPLEERISNVFSPKSVYISKTSGSSGHPFIFAKDRFCHALTWAEFIDRYNWFGIDLNKSIQARFYGIPLDKFGYYRERIKDKMGYRYRFPIFNLNEEKMEAFLVDFRRKTFDYINGYTSSINEYGASELGLLAFENPEDEWIFNSETMFVEIVDEEGRILPDGEEGRIIITSLYNKAHPFIRYDIGDTGSLDPASTPKKPILRKLLGRTNDVAFLPSGKVVPGLTFYYVTKSIIENDGRVKEFIVQQTEPTGFKVIYVSEVPLPQEKLQEIKKAMATYLEEGLQINFTHVTTLNRSKRGKLKQFESLL